MGPLMAKKRDKSTDMTSEAAEAQVAVMAAAGADDEVEDEVVEVDDDALIEDDGSAWLPDPDVEGQERFWDGTEWTDEVRPVEDVRPVEEEPDLLLDDALTEDEGSERLPDPDVAGPERFGDWTEGTDHLRPVQDVRALEDVRPVEGEPDLLLDALMEDDGSGWRPDPDVEGQERFWDGTEWTDEIRPVEEVRPVDDEPDFLQDDELTEDDGSGWRPDPGVEGQERYWDGTEWTDQTRPVEVEADSRGRRGLPDHVPELQRALAEATADIDDVEARLSSLFERRPGKKKGTDAPSGAAQGAQTAQAAPWAVGEPTIHGEFGGASSEGGAHPINGGGEEAGEAFGSGDDDEAAFAELDAALAAEAPDKTGRRFFKRRS